MSVAIGVDPKTFIVNDTGLPRSGSNILAMAGYRYATLAAATLRYLIWYAENENFSQSPDIAPNDFLIAIKRWPHLTYFLKHASEFQPIVHKSLAAFFIYITMTIDEELSHEFFKKLLTGEKLGKTSSIRLLREMLIKLRMQKMRLDKRHMIASFILAWNAFIEKQRIKTVRWDGREFPMITGVDREKLNAPNSGFSAKQFKD